MKKKTLTELIKEKCPIIKAELEKEKIPLQKQIDANAEAIEALMTLLAGENNV